MAQPKRDFQSKMKRQFDELNTRWGLERRRFEEMARHATAEGLKKLEKEREEFRKRRAQMKEKLIDIEVASENAWDDVKAKSEMTWNALNESFKKLISRIK